MRVEPTSSNCPAFMSAAIQKGSLQLDDSLQEPICLWLVLLLKLVNFHPHVGQRLLQRSDFGDPQPVLLGEAANMLLDLRLDICQDLFLLGDFDDPPPISSDNVRK